MCFIVLGLLNFYQGIFLEILTKQYQHSSVWEFKMRYELKVQLL